MTSLSPSGKDNASSRAFWLKHLHRWHWISAALSLIGMLLFAATGITLNHAADIEGSPKTVERTAQLPTALFKALPHHAEGEKAPLPQAVSQWAAQALSITTTGRAAEWSADEVYLALPRPGGDGWISIDRATGEVTMEQTDRGWISWANDLHKGRNTGTPWSWFIDVFAIACLVFTITGLVLLQLHAANRPSTWPIVGFGLVLPLIIIILFMH